MALLSGRVTPKVQAYLFALAAGVIVALAFGDLFPESLEMAGHGAIACFIGGFALLLLVENFFYRHEHGHHYHAEMQVQGTKRWHPL